MSEEKLNKFSRTNCKSEDINYFPSITNLSLFCTKTPDMAKSKKSCSLLSALVRRTKRKKSKQEENKGSGLNCVSSTSTFDSNYGDKKGKHSVSSTDSEPSIDTINKTKNKFFSKFLVKHSSTEIEKRNFDNLVGDDAQKEKKENIEDLKINDEHNVSFPLSSIKLEKPTLSTPLIEGLTYLQSLTLRLEQSEKYFMNLFKQYVSDITLRKELVGALSAHSSLHLETERTTYHLSFEMWSKQLEIEKGQQNTLQDALGSVIKQNRRLITEYEDMFLTYEKFLKKFGGISENGYSKSKEIQDVMKSKEKLFLEIRNSCNLLKNDVESIGTKLNDFPFEIDWTRLEGNAEDNLQYIIQVGHLCLENLTKEVMSLRNELIIKVKTIENLLATNGKLQENFKKSTRELDDLTKKIDDCGKMLSEHKRTFLKTEQDVNSDKLERAKLEYDMEKDILIEKIVYYEKINNEAMTDKQYLLKENDLLRQEYQKQQNEIACMTNNNKTLLQKIEAEHKTVISLQIERKNYLEEKSLLKIIFERMKKELSRLQKLEFTVADVSNEANKLAIVSEYNKELVKKLKAEVEEKDKNIIKLRKTIELLNEIQLKNTKEKLSLCSEITELSELKEKLDIQLSDVFKKNESLDEAKKEIVQFTNFQLEQIEQVQKKERTAFKELLKNLKLVTKQRNTLLKEREITLKELETIKKQVEEDDKKIKNFLSVKEENEFRLKSLQKIHEEDGFKICRLQDKLRLESKTYEENVKQLELLIYELRNEKSNMEDSIKYLQNNTQKLHNDLNASRSIEKELKDSMDKCLTKQRSLEEAAIKNEHITASLTVDKEHLTKELHKLNQFCEKLLLDLERNLNNSTEKEELFKQELDQKKEMLLRSDIKNEQLIKEVLDKNEELKRLQADIEDIKSKNIQFQEKVEHLSNIRLNVIELTEKLEQEKLSYAALSEIHEEISSKYIESIKKNVEEKEARLDMENQLKQVKEQLEIISTENAIRLEENLSKQEEIKAVKADNEKLKKECQENQNIIFSLRQDNAQFQQQLIGLEFQKCELTLRLHEIQRKYDAQVNLCDELQDVQKVILSTIHKLRENELIDQEQCNCLTTLIKNNSLNDVKAQSSV